MTLILLRRYILSVLETPCLLKLSIFHIPIRIIIALFIIALCLMPFSIIIPAKIVHNFDWAGAQFLYIVICLRLIVLQGGLCYCRILISEILEIILCWLLKRRILEVMVAYSRLCFVQIVLVEILCYGMSLGWRLIRSLLVLGN